MRPKHSGHSKASAERVVKDIRQNRLFQLERWQTVFDANGSSRANVIFVGFGIARTGPKA